MYIEERIIIAEVMFVSKLTKNPLPGSRVKGGVSLGVHGLVRDDVLAKLKQVYEDEVALGNDIDIVQSLLPADVLIKVRLETLRVANPGRQIRLL